MGIGPVCIAIMFVFTGMGIALVKSGALKSGMINNALPFVIAGILCIAGGIALWLAAVIGCRIDIKIKSNQLETCGIYAYVRNPIYSAFLFVCTGALLFVFVPSPSCPLPLYPHAHTVPSARSATV